MLVRISYFIHTYVHTYTEGRRGIHFSLVGFKHDLLISELLNCVSVKYKPVYDVSVIVLPVDITVITSSLLH